MNRCPYCGLPVVGEVATHIAWTQECQAAQIAAVLWPESGPEESE